MANIDMANVENMAFVSASEAYERGFAQGHEDGINQGIRAFCKLCGLSESPLCDGVKHCDRAVKFKGYLEE